MSKKKPGNALKHGIYSQEVILPGEKPRNYARLREGLLGHGADVSDDTEREPAARVEEPLSA